MSENDRQQGDSPETKPVSGAQQKGSSDLVTGIITFIIFIIFMTIWMNVGSK